MSRDFITSLYMYLINMATSMAYMEDRHRSMDLKSTRSPKTKSSSLKHKSRTPADAFRQSEQSLRELLEDFESGRLNAFGKIYLSCLYMDYKFKCILVCGIDLGE